MSHEGDKAMSNESQWTEDKADWPHAASVVQGGVVPAKPAQSYCKTQQKPPIAKWIDPNDKAQSRYLPHIGEPVLFCHRGKTYYGIHTGGGFQADCGGTAKLFGTWDCMWMPLPEAADTQKGGTA